MAKKILILEDEEEMAHALSEALKSYGYSVERASNGEEGLEMFKKGSYDMAITDVKMPKMNGIDFLRAVREREGSTPIIVMTAYGSIDDAVDVMKAGAYDYLLKPFSLYNLEKIVNRALSGKSSSGNGLPQQNSADKSDSSTESLIVFSGKKMGQIMDMAERVAPSPSTILIQGESGTGKELVARFIHLKSNRSQGPFVAVNCAALPKDLLESELFGYEKGAFTGAVNRKTGKFELANKGTILLDEIGDMDLGLQAKLLRVLQEKQVDRVGGNSPVSVDVRAIATTNRNLREMVDEGSFREDLYFRLNVVPIYLPPLRERKEDIQTLVIHFIEKHSKAIGKNITGLDAQAMQDVLNYNWRGNVRELENVIERGILLSRGEKLTSADMMLSEETCSHSSGGESDTVKTIWEMERQLILNTLDKEENNRTKAAELLGISIRTLRNKLNEYKEKNMLA